MCENISSILIQSPMLMLVSVQIQSISVLSSNKKGTFMNLTTKQESFFKGPWVQLVKSIKVISYYQNVNKHLVSAMTW